MSMNFYGDKPAIKSQIKALSGYSDLIHRALGSDKYVYNTSVACVVRVRPRTRPTKQPRTSKLDFPQSNHGLPKVGRRFITLVCSKVEVSEEKRGN